MVDAYAWDNGPAAPPSNDPSASGIFGNDFSSSIAGQITAVLWWCPASGGPTSVTVQVHLQSDQSLITTQASGTLVAGTVNRITLSSPVTVTTSVKYTASAVMASAAKLEYQNPSTDRTASGVTAYGATGRFKVTAFSVGDYPTSTDADTGMPVGVEFTPTAADSGPVAGPRDAFAPARLSPAGQWSPWAGAADTATVVDVPLTDTATAADAAAVSATLQISETGAAADTATIAAAVPLSETGSATDAVTASVAVPLADTSSAADTVATSAAVPLAETGSAADAAGIAASAPLADTATGADTITPAATVALTDTATTDDTVSSAAAVPIGDTATATDALDLGTPVAVTDTAAAADTLSADVQLVLTDTASGADALAIVAQLALTEAAAVLDALTGSADVPFADTGSVDDAINAGDSSSADKTLADDAAALDRLHVAIIRPGASVVARPGGAMVGRPGTGIILRP